MGIYGSDSTIPCFRKSHVVKRVIYFALAMTISCLANALDYREEICEKDTDGDGVGGGLNTDNSLINPNNTTYAALQTVCPPITSRPPPPPSWPWGLTQGTDVSHKCESYGCTSIGTISLSGGKVVSYSYTLENDNCPTISNSDQSNSDGDGQGNACDDDDDNDGILDGNDNCPINSNANQADYDADFAGNACDLDDDNDGIQDTNDRFPLNNAASVDTDRDGFPESWNENCNLSCQLNSGLAIDNCPSIKNADQLNSDTDTQGNACDSDDDNDGVTDGSDAFPLNVDEWLDTDTDGTGNNADHDDDDDGTPDVIDLDPLNPAVNETNMPLDGNYKGSTVKDSTGL